MKKILCTGGLGFIGSNLVEYLHRINLYKIYVIDNLSSESSDINYKLKHKNIEYIIDDVQNIHNIESINTLQFDVIFHLAADARIQPSFNNPLNTLKNNILSTSVICDFARTNARKLIYAGSSSFYAGQKKSPYSFSKWVGEETCDLYSKVYGLQIGIARFFNVYGFRQPTKGDYATVIGVFQRNIRNKKNLTIYGDGTQRRAFTNVRDICKGLYDIWQNNTVGIYNLSEETDYSINEIADMFIKYSQTNVEKEYLPKRINETDQILPDVSKSIKDINWSPKENIENYIKTLYENPIGW